MFDLSSVAFEVSSSLTENSFAVKRTHIHEALAALLGYQTYAALKADAPTSLSVLDSAENLVLQSEDSKNRCSGLGIGDSETDFLVTDAVQRMTATATAAGLRAYTSDSHFIDGFLTQYIEKIALDSGETSSAMAETNASGGLPNVEDITVECSVLHAVDGWTAEALVVVEMDQDPGRPFSGDTINVSVRVSFDVVGRVGLILAGKDVSASVDISWYDDGEGD